MFSHLIGALGSLGHPDAVAFLILGAVIGVVIGVIPGLSSAVVLSLILVFVYHMNLVDTLCLFLGAHAGSYYSASITSILLNTPAHPEAYAVTFDGYPMARRGEARRALGISAASTCIGGLIGCVILVALVPVLGELPILFHPPEYLAVVTFAMILVATMGAGSPIRALPSIGLGFMVASIGASPTTGESRFTFGFTSLYGGIELVSLALGIFAVTQMVMIYGTGTTSAGQDLSGRRVSPAESVVLDRGNGRQVLGGALESCRHWALNLQSGVLGALAGLIPGMGGFVANFISYGVARETSRHKARFGTGIAEGIIAPEGASLAKEAGGMIPILGLGIAGGVGGALFLAALSIEGVQTGFDLPHDYPDLTYQVAWVIALTGIIGTAIGVMSGRFLAQVTKVRGPLLVPFVFALAVIGSFVAVGSFYAVVEVLVFGVIGLTLRRLGFSLASFILGLVLGPTFEANIYLTRNLYPGVSMFAERPVATAIFALAVLVPVAQVVQSARARRRRRAAAAVAASVTPAEAGQDTGSARAPAGLAGSGGRNDYPLLQLVTNVVLIAVSAFFVCYAANEYAFSAAAMPVIGGLAVLIPTCAGLGIQVHQLATGRQRLTRRAAPAEPPATEPAGRLPSSATELPGTAWARPRDAGGDGAAGTASAVGVDVMTSEPARTARPSIVAESWGRRGQYTRELTAFAWLVALMALCYCIGFEAGIPIFMLAYGIVSARRFLNGRMNRLIFIVASAAVMWGVTFLIIYLVNPYFVPLL
jgi:putative tricarboxylic transport membrane protein